MLDTYYRDFIMVIRFCVDGNVRLFRHRKAGLFNRFILISKD